MVKIKLTKPHVIAALEEQFHSLHKKILKAKDEYVANHQKELKTLRKKSGELRTKFARASANVIKASKQAEKTGAKAARTQLKKVRAASLLLGSSLKEAKQILVTAESHLHAAKPFDRKLHARAKALQKFEKDWEKKTSAEVAAKSQCNKKAAAKRKGKTLPVLSDSKSA